METDVLTYTYADIKSVTLAQFKKYFHNIDSYTSQISSTVTQIYANETTENKNKW